MDIELHDWSTGTRPCRFCLCLQGGCVFADFDVDEAGCIYAVRVSFDGYGCCTCPAGIGRMSRDESDRLLAMVASGSLDRATVGAMLRRYFESNQDVIWSDALREHDLLSASLPPR